MKIIRVVCCLIFVFINSLLHAQFNVEFNQIEDTLKESDKYQKDFGRYKGYEIELYEGEAINFIAYSSKFSPKLVLVDPNGKIFKEAISNNSNIASLITRISHHGQWILYVIGDSLSEGNYSIQLAIVSSNSRFLPENSDFCTSLDFILAHSKANFLFFENSIDSRNSFAKLNGAINAFVDESEGAYVATFYDGNNLIEAEKIYKEIIMNIKNCLDNKWKIQSKDWQKVEDYKIKGTLINGNKNDSESYIQISLIDFKNSKQKFLSDYVVQIEIIPKHDK